MCNIESKAQILGVSSFEQIENTVSFWGQTVEQTKNRKKECGKSDEYAKPFLRFAGDVARHFLLEHGIEIFDFFCDFFVHNNIVLESRSDRFWGESIRFLLTLQGIFTFGYGNQIC